MEKRPRIFYGWIILGVAFITIILGYTIRNTFSVFYPAVVDEFGWERGHVHPFVKMMVRAGYTGGQGKKGIYDFWRDVLSKW